MAKEITGADLVKLEDAYKRAVNKATSAKNDTSHRKAMAEVQKAYDALAKAREQLPNPQPWGKYSAGIPDFE